MSDQRDIPALLERGVGLHQAGRVREAEEIYDQVLAQVPNHFDALNLKAIILADDGRHADALVLFDLALHANETGAEPYFNKGLSLSALGHDEEALTAYAQAISRKPDHANARFNTGLLLKASGRGPEALAAFGAMTKHCGSDSRGFYSLAVCQLEARQYSEAAVAAERARALTPDSPVTLGLSAEIAFARGALDAAHDFALRALSFDAELTSAHRVLGDLFLRRMRYDEARAHYESALTKKTGQPAIFANYALLLERMGRHDEAAAAYKEALRLQPNDPEIRCGLALSLLVQGKLEEAWPFYAWRFISRKERPAPERRPLANAPPRPNAPLLLISEQALGEQVMFAGLFPDLLRITHDIEVRCEPRLLPLLRRSFPGIRFEFGVEEGEAISGTIGDAARWLRPTLASFPRHHGYLRADENRRTALRARYKRNGQPLVGISWATRGKLGTPKSIPLPEWRNLLANKQATFVSLQYGDAASEVAQANAAHDFDIVFDETVDPDKDLDGLAAQIAAMDFVITTSNTTAHIAGALNVPTLVLVPAGFGTLWHWFIGREDSPWYPSARIFRQSTRGEWTDVLARASVTLEAFIAAQPSRTAFP